MHRSSLSLILPLVFSFAVGCSGEPSDETPSPSVMQTLPPGNETPTAVATATPAALSPSPSAPPTFVATPSATTAPATPTGGPSPSPHAPTPTLGGSPTPTQADATLTARDVTPTAHSATPSPLSTTPTMAPTPTAAPTPTLEPTPTAPTDADGDGYPAAEDCDDDDARVNPGATEVCDDLNTDEDCDGAADDLDDSADSDSMTLYFTDADDDGYGAEGDVGALLCDPLDGQVAIGGDCDDADPSFNPAAAEDDCTDPNDYNCDGAVGYVDGDGDGYAACEDCDDDDALTSPEGTEVCDGKDNDCDNLVDGDDAVDRQTFYADLDGDTYGDDNAPALACERPDAHVERSGDCDDDAPAVNPAAVEICDGQDNNCDGETDGEDATDRQTFYTDADGDGFGDATSSTLACEAPADTSDKAGDCDDSDAQTYEGADERCDGADNDCDEKIDEDPVDPGSWYADEDSDGYGGEGPTLACEAPDGHVSASGDCDDGEALTYPGAQERCDGDIPADNDCDGQIDEDATGQTVFYVDSDGDGYGLFASPTSACSQPEGYAPQHGDCDDADSTVYTGADELCDGKDNNCDGISDNNAVDAMTWYLDRDDDGFGATADAFTGCVQPANYVEAGGDCLDTDPDAYPGADERCADGGDAQDDDCDGIVDEDPVGGTTFYTDADGDGYGDAVSTTNACDLPDGFAENGDDCDDARTTVNPGQTEICDNERDDSCSGAVDCDDTSCDLDAACLPPEDCNAEGDEDLDGDSDCEDPDCFTAPVCQDPCYGMTCGDGQSCSEGQCLNSCEGVAVPGDYASIQSAVDALATVGGTICVGEGSFNDDVSITPRAAMEIIGVHRDLSVVNGSLNIAGGSANTGGLVISGLTFNEGGRIDDLRKGTPVYLLYDRFTAASTYGLYIERDDYETEVIIDGCDLTAASNREAVRLQENGDYVSDSDDFQVTIQNSYFHHANIGLTVDAYVSSGSTYPDAAITVANNTFDDLGSALSVNHYRSDLSLTLANNLFTHNDLAMREVYSSGSLSVTRQRNAFYGNTTNFSGQAVAGSGAIFTDPRLDLSTPGEPRPDSPLVDTAASTWAPDADYHGFVRSAAADIGAVEFQGEPVGCPGVSCHEICGDGADNDGDGHADCADRDCWYEGSVCGEVCSGEEDEDGDGLLDCQDPDCAGASECVSLCEDVACHADQLCVAGQCQFECDGSRVPGDYDSVEMAVGALASAGGTICVGEGSFGGFSLSPQAPLSIIGLDRDRSHLDGAISVTRGGVNAGAMTLRGFSAEAGVVIDDTRSGTSTRLHALRLTNPSGRALYIERDDYETHVTVDACDISGGRSYDAIRLQENGDYLSDSDDFVVTVTNSYIHGSSYGIYVDAYVSSGSVYPDLNVKILGNTFDDNTTGLYLNRYRSDLTFLYSSNAFLGSTTAVNLNNASGSGTPVGRYNAFFDNTTNFAGSALPTSSVFADPALDARSLPPVPTGASSLIGAAYPADAPSSDYYGHSRDDAPDIGAVEAIGTQDGCIGGECVEDCAQEGDEDGDGLADCDDSDCWDDGGACAEVCSAEGDEDGDGLEGCEDPDCRGEAACQALCDESQCRGDQICVAGSCQFECDGFDVPGDFATLQGALDAINPVGGTLCIGAVTLNEDVTFSPQNSVQVIGVDRGQSVVDGSLTISGGRASAGAIRFKGLAITEGATVDDTRSGTSTTFSACTLSNPSGRALYIERDDYETQVTVDGCEISSSRSQHAIRIQENGDYLSDNDDFIVTLTNNYIHDSDVGIYVDAYVSSGSTYPDLNLKVINNTLADNDVGFDLRHYRNDLTLTNQNNVFAYNGLGLREQLSSGSVNVSRWNNAYFGNTTTFDGGAVPGTSPVTSDPRLDDRTTPPSPGGDSPLIGAGRVSGAPAVDFFGTTRGTSVDIGAVQFGGVLDGCLGDACVEVCTSGVDDDGDGLEGCQDPDCYFEGTTCAEVCSAEGDEDGDGLEGCQDPDCAGEAACQAQCDDVLCAADQQCLAGSCVTPCEGTRVPQDYATVQKAIDAVSPVGGTICLGARSYAETLSLTPRAPVSIIGQDKARSIISGSLTVQGGNTNAGTQLFKSLAITGGTTVDDTRSGTRTTFTDARLSHTSGRALYIERDDYETYVTVDRCDLSTGGAGEGIRIQENGDYLSDNDDFKVVVQNSYIHDTTYGVYLDAYVSSGSTYPDTVVDLIGNTFEGSQGAARLSHHRDDLTLTYQNNLFVDNTTAIYETTSSGSLNIRRYNNAFHGNNPTFDGAAVAGASDLFTDPRLDSRVSPPALNADSPLIGAGRTSGAPSYDYWGNARVDAPDIGASEFGAGALGGCVDGSCLEICGTGDDEDGDGATDCDDSDCHFVGSGCGEVCGSGMDEDGDGQIDCADADCEDTAACEALCDDTVCRSDQRCLGGSCQFDCDGLTVPGDYPDLQTALAALSPTGGTLCLGARTYNEAITVLPTSAINIIGVSMDATTINGTVTVSRGQAATGGTLLKGLAITQGVIIDDLRSGSPVDIIASRVSATSGDALYIERDDYETEVLVDGCDISSSGSGYAIRLAEYGDYLSDNDDFKVTIQNSWIHGGSRGIYADFYVSSGSTYPDQNLSILGNTITGNSYGVDLRHYRADMTLRLAGNIITGNTWGISSSLSSGSVNITNTHNLLYGNTNNYSGDATPGTATVTGDPRLDTRTAPPSPMAESASVNAGPTASYFPDQDYYANNRDESPDIGAVEFGAGATDGCVDGSCLEQCDDGGDDDGDGLTDCDDPDCWVLGGLCEEDCTAEGDEDGDGEAGCDDLDCAAEPSCASQCDDIDCHADQLCSGGVCRFPCEGLKVPGDYSTLSAAVGALTSDGGQICLGDRVYNEAFSLTPQAPLTITGWGMDTTEVSGQAELTHGSASAGPIRLKGIFFSEGVRIDDLRAGTPAFVDNCRIHRDAGAALYIRRDDYETEATIDGCDIYANLSYDAVQLVDHGDYLSDYDNFVVTVQNSWLHDSDAGLFADLYISSGSVYPDQEFVIINNTFDGNDYGLDINKYRADLSLVYANNIFVDNGVGIRESLSSGSTNVTRSHNSLFGNTTNYDGAVPGTSYITTDPLLGPQMPPVPGAGSQCIDGGSASWAPALDYWGDVRGASPDIGAVEASP